MTEFDYQWKNLPSPHTTFTPERINEFLQFVRLPINFFYGKKCLDVGCGNGRWAYALQQLGADVDSFDISPGAVDKAQVVNPDARLFDLLELVENRIHDFVLCWGVLHHLPNPRLGFLKVASQVKPGGTLHIMVYHKDMQKVYEYGRQIWQWWNKEQRLAYCQQMIKQYGGDLHGWWDAFNPRYNWTFSPGEIIRMFKDAGFRKIKMTQKYNINMRGVYR